MEPTEVEIAYTAGLVDGEGLISCSSSLDGRRMGVMVNISNTKRELLEWVQERFGGHVYTQTRQKAHPGRKPLYYWSPAGNAYGFLEQVLPYLLIKRPQAELLLQFRSMRWAGKSPRQMPSELLAARCSLLAEIRRLNKRGIT